MGRTVSDALDYDPVGPYKAMVIEAAKNDVLPEESKLRVILGDASRTRDDLKRDLARAQIRAQAAADIAKADQLGATIAALNAEVDSERARHAEVFLKARLEF